MRPSNLGWGRLAGLVLAVTAGCEKPGNVPATTPVAASNASNTITVPGPAAMPAASPSSPARSEWTVRPRFRIDADGNRPQETQCFPGINDVLPLADGAAWIFGNCGLRVRLEPGGGHTDFTAPWEPLHIPLGIAPFCCAAMPDFTAAAALGAGDVSAAAGTSCQMDPSSATQLPLERYDGVVWKKVGNAFPESAHGASIDALLWGGRSLYALSIGNDQADFPCSLYAFGADRWKSVRRCVRVGKTRERFTAMAVDGQGRPWIAGAKERPDGWFGLVAFLDGSKWTEESPGLAQPTALSIAADGAVWTGTLDTLLRRTGAGTYVDVPLPDGFELGSILAKSESEVWVGGETEVLRFTGTGTVTERLSVPSLSRPDGTSAGRMLTLRAAADSIWAFDGLTVWELSRSATALPVVAQRPRGVTPEDLDAMSKRPASGPRACKPSKP